MTESQLTYEANKVTPPLKNTAAMKCIAVLIYGPATQTQDLTALFGRYEAGHFLTMRADGGKCYVAFGTLAGTIDESAVGSGATACWPIADGENLSVWPVHGEERATGVATLLTYPILHYKGQTGQSTGYLRLYRSSLSPNEDAGFFRAP